MPLLCVYTLRHAALAPSSRMFQKREDSLLVVLGYKVTNPVDPDIISFVLVISCSQGGAVEEDPGGPLEMSEGAGARAVKN